MRVNEVSIACLFLTCSTSPQPRKRFGTWKTVLEREEAPHTDRGAEIMKKIRKKAVYLVLHGLRKTILVPADPDYFRLQSLRLILLRLLVSRYFNNRGSK